MDKLVISFSNFVSQNKEEAGTIMAIPLFMEILMCIHSLLFPRTYGALSVSIVCLLFAGGYGLFKAFIPTVTEERRARYLGILNAEFYLLALYLLFISFVCVARQSKIGFLGIAAMGFFLATILFVWFSYGKTAEKRKADLANMQTIDEYLGLNELKPGDVILCADKVRAERRIGDSRVIIPYKDRFLHMLILGPTGSGKTSQILLPLINQDLQNPDVGVIVLEPKGDLAQQAKYIAEHYGRSAIYFDPAMDDCPHFNPMAGREIDVVENMATTFRMLMPDSATFFLDLSEQLVRYSVKVLKRLDKAEGIDGKYSNLITMAKLMQNTGGDGRTLLNKFQTIKAPTDQESKENQEICSWFLNDYYPERSKVYENTSGVRSQVTKICSNEFLRQILNPDITKGEKNDIDFDKALEKGQVLCISTSQGVLRGLSKFLGYFMILQLESAVFRRSGTEDTRRACFLYIDEFQTYSTPGFSDMLTQGRSYRVASHLATQARSQMEMGGGKDGKDFVNLVSTNARNVVLFPGLSKEDGEYYEKQFGMYKNVETSTTKTVKGFNPFSGGFTMPGHPSESIREQEVDTANMSLTDIIYRPFGEIVYSIIQKNSLQHAGIGVVNFIDSDLKHEVDAKIRDYLEQHTKKPAEIIFKEKKQEGESGIEWEEDIETQKSQGGESNGGKPEDSEDKSDESPKAMKVPPKQEKDDIFGGLLK